MSLTVTIIVIVLAVVILVMLNLVNRVNVKGVDKVHFKNEWNDITELASDPKTCPMSVINADKLLDEALKCLGFSGNTMAERLISAKRQIKSKDQVWQAHKLRNKLVHETSRDTSPSEVKKALSGYYKAFKELGVF
jgi:hypothetical protein